MTEVDSINSECMTTDTAEIIVETFEDGTGRIEIAEYATEIKDRPALDVLAYLTADEMRELADHLMAAADLMEDTAEELAYDPAEDGADADCTDCTTAGIACDAHAVGSES